MCVYVNIYLLVDWTLLTCDKTDSFSPDCFRNDAACTAVMTPLPRTSTCTTHLLIHFTLSSGSAEILLQEFQNSVKVVAHSLFTLWQFSGIFCAVFSVTMLVADCYSTSHAVMQWSKDDKCLVFNSCPSASKQDLAMGLYAISFEFLSLCSLKPWVQEVKSL